MAIAKNRCVRLAKAPLMLAPAVASTILMCACPARETASGQGSATTATQLATDSKTEGVSLWYEFVVSEIGFMLDENGELPKSLDDWKRRVEDVGGRTVTTQYVGDDEGQITTEPLPENEVQFEFGFMPRISLYFFSDLTEWSCLSYNLDLYSLPSRDRFSPGQISRLAAIARGSVEEISQEETSDFPEIHISLTHFHERGIGYRAVVTTNSDKPIHSCSVYVYNLETAAGHDVESIELFSSGFDLASIEHPQENVPRDDAPKLPVEPEPDPWRDFVAEPLSWLLSDSEEIPEFYSGWHRLLSSQRFQEELNYLYRDCERENFALSEVNDGVVLGLEETIRLSSVKVLFRSALEPWISISYTRGGWRWDEKVFDPAYLQKMADKYGGSLECSESTRPFWQRKFSPFESFISGEGRWIQQKEIEANLLLRHGDYGYMASLSLSDNSERESGEGWILPGIDVTIFALDRIGPLTEENIKDAEMLKTLRKLAALPASK